MSSSYSSPRSKAGALAYGFLRLWLEKGAWPFDFLAREASRLEISRCALDALRRDGKYRVTRLTDPKSCKYAWLPEYPPFPARYEIKGDEHTLAAR